MGNKSLYWTFPAPKRPLAAVLEQGITVIQKGNIIVIKSTHRVEIVPVVLLTHPAADLLSIVPIFDGGYTFVARTSDWLGVLKGAYIPPDSIVDVTRPEFNFLLPESKDGKTYRVRAKKLRGIQSFGLMIPVPDDTPLGEDWAERLGVLHYEPPLPGEARGKGPVMGGDTDKGPEIYAPHYDLDAFRRYHDVFVEGEPVVCTEKCDGASARYVYNDGKFHCGSRNRWTREFPSYSHVTMEFLTSQGVTEEKATTIIEGLNSKVPKRNVWWQALRDTPELEKFLENNPGVVVYGEIFGSVNRIKYGLDRNRFAAFDVMVNGVYLSPGHAKGMLDRANVPMVPLFNEELTAYALDGSSQLVGIPYNFDALCAMAEGPTLVSGAKPGTIREGVVVSPLVDRYDPVLGRIKLKIVSSAFLEKF